MENEALREQIARALTWNEARAAVAEILHNIPPDQRGYTHPDLPYSIWQLAEHIRIGIHDIVTFTIGEGYEEIRWPDDYWPKEPAPPSEEAWDLSVQAIEQDLKKLQTVVLDTDTDLMTKISGGTGQTVLREVLLVIDHTSYHLGQMVVLLRLAGAWPAK